MKKINFAGYNEQKAEHDKFTEILLDANLRDIDNNQDKYIENLLVFVLRVICNHIMTKDKLIKYSTFAD